MGELVVIGLLLAWNIALNVLLLKKDGYLKAKPVAQPKEEKKPAFYHGMPGNKTK